MQLLFSEILHLSLSLIIGWLVSQKTLISLKWSLLTALVGGFLIDADHLIDQWIFFGFNLDPFKFFSGSSFIYSDKAYIYFHGWEYVLLLVIILLLFKKSKRFLKAKILLLSLTLSMFGHLMIDSNTNRMSYNAYSIVYRIKHNFNLEQLVAPENWQKHLKEKQAFELI